MPNAGGISLCKTEAKFLAKVSHNTHHPLQPRVTINKYPVRVVLVLPLAPVVAIPLHRTQIPDRPYNLTRALEELYAETGGNVEGDMTMHEPCTGVVGLEGKHEVAGSR